jgi:cation diffusion facilitator CzcD-associated flavoprotein CzcO
MTSKPLPNVFVVGGGFVGIAVARALDGIETAF